MSRRLGLIAGVNQFQDPQFQPLQFAEQDARALAQWLVNAKGGNWSPADVQLVQGSHVTKELFESLIAQLCLQNAGPEDTVLIYFAGHAFVDERSGEGFLALSNTAYQNAASGLHLSSLVQQVLTRSRASQIVCILDCFQTGPAWSRQRISASDFKPLFGSAILNMLPQYPNRLFLCSCRGNEFGQEFGERSLGTFVYQMIVGLCGPATDPSIQAQTLQQLYVHLNSALREQQRPQIFGQAQQPIVISGGLEPSQPTPPPSQPLSPASSMQQPTPFANPAPVLSGYNANASMSPASTMAPKSSGLRYATPPQPEPASNIANAQQQVQQLLNQARQQMQRQFFPDALNSVEQVLQFQPQNSAALTMKSQLLATMGRAQEAMMVVEQLLQVEPQNALAWSIRAVIFNTMGQFQAAREAIEHSLELDANNTESYAIKTRIMDNMAAAQSQQAQGRQESYGRLASVPQKSTEGMFLSIMIQIVAFLLGVVGTGVSIIVPAVPPQVSLALGSLGLALLGVWATRGAYRHGPIYLLPTIVLSLIAGGLIGAFYKLGYMRILTLLQAHTALLIPFVALVVWLASATVLPPILAIIGLISRAIAGGRRK
jgi:tetratricopeptide (TPR) repeat protein